MSVTYYTVEAGDQLYRILRTHYGDKFFFDKGEDLITQVRKNNQHISNIDMIYPGQTIALAGEPGVSGQSIELAADIIHEVPSIANELSQSTSAVRNAMADITAERIAKQVGGSYVKYVKRQSEVAINSFKNVSQNYDSKARQQITRGAYDGRRIKYMSKYDQSLGALKPLHRPVNASRAVLHISPKANVPNGSLLTETKTLNRYLKTASKGVVILRVAAIAETTSKVMLADTGSEQVKEVAKSGGGLGGAVIGGVAGGLIFGAMIASPVGWVAIGGILLAGSVGIGGSIAGEELAERMSDGLLYDENGQAIYKDKLFSTGFSIP